MSFTTKKNKHYYPNLVKHNLPKFVKENNLKQITVHIFRHPIVVLFLNRVLLSKRYNYYLGLTDVKTTMDIYSHVTKQKKEETASLFADFMNEPKQIKYCMPKTKNSDFPDERKIAKG